MGFCIHILWTMGSNRLDFGHSDSLNEFLRIFFFYIFVSKNISNHDNSKTGARICTKFEVQVPKTFVKTWFIFWGGLGQRSRSKGSNSFLGVFPLEFCNQLIACCCPLERAWAVRLLIIFWALRIRGRPLAVGPLERVRNDCHIPWICLLPFF